MVSRLGDGSFWYAMLAMVWITKGLPYGIQIVYLVLGSSIGTALYKFLKHKTTRPRPYQVHQVIVLGERPLDHFSFPSGHTLHAVMATICLGYVMPVLVTLMLPFTLLVALSRMILGLHYPSDVMVGALIGASIAGMIIFVRQCWALCFEKRFSLFYKFATVTRLHLKQTGTSNGPTLDRHH